jgi:putative mRNA 3-end processing factor
VRDTGAARVIETHGNTDAIVRARCEEGNAAEAIRTGYGGED